MRSVILILAFFPCLVFAQATKEDYAMYSQYLDLNQKDKSAQFNFIVRQSTDYIIKYDKTSINEMVNEFRGFTKEDKESIADLEALYRLFIPVLKTDTLWIPLIAELNQKMQYKFVVKNEFSPGLQTTVIRDHAYKKYFGKHKNIKKGWERFHGHYGKISLLIDLSAIANDGKHAVFYFARRCGGLCGAGQLVLFYKENSEWKYLMTLNIWQS
jgi:hypothetical protein